MNPDVSDIYRARTGLDKSDLNRHVDNPPAPAKAEKAAKAEAPVEAKEPAKAVKKTTAKKAAPAKVKK